MAPSALLRSTSLPLIQTPPGSRGGMAAAGAGAGGGDGGRGGCDSFLRVATGGCKGTGVRGGSSSKKRSACWTVEGTGRLSTFGTLAAVSLQQGGKGFLHGLDGSCGFHAFNEQARLRTNRSARLTLVIESEFDVACWVSLEEGQVEGPELPMIVGAGTSCSASYSAVAADNGGTSRGIHGSLVIEGFRETIPFRVHAGVPSGATVEPRFANFVVEPSRLRATVTTLASRPEQREAEGAPTLPIGAADAPGIIADLRMSKDSLAKLSVTIRKATDAEALRDAERTAAAAAPAAAAAALPP